MQNLPACKSLKEELIFTAKSQFSLTKQRHTQIFDNPCYILTQGARCSVVECLTRDRGVVGSSLTAFCP